MSNSPHSSQRCPTLDAQNGPPAPQARALAHPQFWEASLSPTKSPHQPLSTEGKLDPFRPRHPHITDLSVTWGAPSYLSHYPPWLLGLLVQNWAGPRQRQKGPSGSGPAAPSQRRLPAGGVRETGLFMLRRADAPSPCREPKTHLQISRKHVFQFALLAPTPLLLLLLIPIS